MIKKIILTFAVLVASVVSSAHEGHGHDAPVSVQAPKGGLIKEVENTYVEVVNKGNDLTIYVYDKNLKQLDPAIYNLAAKAQKPRVKAMETLSLSKKDNAMVTTYNPGKTHRYTLIISIKDPAESHADDLKFTIEPKK